MAQSPQTALPTALVERLEDRLRQLYGTATRVVGTRPISRRAAISVRAEISGSNCPRFIFLKHIFPECYPANDLPREHIEFAEELLAQRFLESCPPAAPYRPRLLAWDADGFFALEYLGESGHGEMRTYDYLVPRIAHALALQHASTIGHETNYYELRRESGLGSAEDDKRRYGGPAQQWRFGMGRDYLLRSAAERGVETTYADEEFERARAFVTNPGRLNAFIHDDLGNARQTFEVDDRLYLLDYEYARYGPGLLDLCKPMLGKFELDYENDTYLWSNAGFSRDLADAYRQSLVELGGPTFTDAEWDNALTAVLTFHALTLIGRLMHLEPDRRLVGTVRQNINSIIYHLYHLLPETTSLQLKSFCRRLLSMPGL